MCIDGCTGPELHHCLGGCPKTTWTTPDGTCAPCTASCGPNEYVSKECDRLSSDVECSPCISSCARMHKFYQHCDGTTREDVNECRPIRLRGNDCPDCAGFTSVSVASASAVGESAADAERKARAGAKAKAASQASTRVGFFNGKGVEQSMDYQGLLGSLAGPDERLAAREQHDGRTGSELLDDLLDIKNGGDRPPPEGVEVFEAPDPPKEAVGDGLGGARPSFGDLLRLTGESR
jgi:hypothetical protein